ncbi:MAG: DNA primase [Longimicrobiales bacterium]|nr:DNA primase [Longimicrobiales bacterium]
MIRDDVVEEVRARADIVEVIGEHVALKRSGKDFKGRCPFHDERTPSFYVVPSKGFYNCFGCGESGDVFTFLMKRLGLSFTDAVRLVAERAGVEIREESRQGGEDPHRHLFEANSFAQGFFEKSLWEEKTGKEARAYLMGRGIGRETAERFGLGFAPDAWRALREGSAVHGISDSVLLEAGLLIQREDGKEPYDRFRNRVIFPIESTSGRVLGFGGRVLGKSEKGIPKYLNSPESPVYLKGEVLYGLSWAKNAIRREEGALVVEGYMDAVSLAAGGIENVVAPLGTSMTEEQARLLARDCTRVFLLFDSDPAGLKATFRAGDVLLAHGLHPAVVTLPPGEDPDTVFRKEGPEGVREYLGQAVDVLDRKLQILEERDYFSSIERTREAVDRLLPTLRAAKDPALRDIYVAKVAERTGVRRETLDAELEKGEVGVSARPRARARVPTPPAGAQRRADLGAERKLLLLLVQFRDYVELAAERMGPEEFSDPSLRAVFQALVEDPELTRPTPGMDPTAARRLEELMGDPERLSEASRVFEDSIGQMKEGQLEARADRLRTALNRETDPSLQRTIAQELEEIARLRREMKIDWRPAIRRRQDPLDLSREQRGK